MQKKKTLKLVFTILGITLLVSGLFFSLFGFIGLKNSDSNKDTTGYIKTEAPLQFEKRKNSDGDTLYFDKLIYYVDGVEYEWVSSFGSSIHDHNAYYVELYYNPLNPRDCIVPFLSHEELFISFKTAGIVCLIVGLLIFLVKIIRIVIFIIIVKSVNKDRNKNNEIYFQNRS